jgi:hypothetical protein
VVLECVRLSKELEKIKESMITEEKRTIDMNTGCFFLIFRNVHDA